MLLVASLTGRPMLGDWGDVSPSASELVLAAGKLFRVTIEPCAVARRLAFFGVWASIEPGAGGGGSMRTCG